MAIVRAEQASDDCTTEVLLLDQAAAPASEADRKLRGGYYTPQPIAEVLTRWAIRDASTEVLEPSCGDGEFLAALIRKVERGSLVTAVELDWAEAAKAELRVDAAVDVIRGDFFMWFLASSPVGRYGAVVGNPPFIRYQSFPEAHRDAAFAIMRAEGLRPSKLTNAWVPFVVAATRALRIGGRLAMVVPAELLQVGYAAELREYLVRKYRRLVIVTFRHLLFEGTQQETVLICGIREDGLGARMKWIELDGLSDLETLDERSAANGVPADLNHAREKWTQYYLSPSELTLVRSLETSDSLTRLDALAEVDVGVVTGRNEFFVLSHSEALEREVLDWCVPIVGRSAQVPGVVLTSAEMNQQAEHGTKCFLLNLTGMTRAQLPEPARRYVEYGEEQDFDRGYKCRIRLPHWWDLPSVWRPDAFLLRQIHDAPRIILNSSAATSTDTVHRVRVKGDTRPETLAAASLNSVTVAFAEIRGRSYGGGVLELEPTEAEALPFPKPSRPTELDEVDRLIRARGIEEALDLVDNESLGTIGRTDLRVMRDIWNKLRRRRLARRYIRGTEGASISA